MVRPANVHGLVVVDKPAGMTSHDVVARCRKVFNQRQVGHAGTLDPDATGVLLIGLGDATRLLRYLSESRKTYVGTVVFGIATDTLDAAGVVTSTQPMHLSHAEIVVAAATFQGEIQQVPPMVSALKVDGKRLHELAREGIEIERKARPITIHDLTVDATNCEGVNPTATITVDCSSGTYIRTLAADLGTALNGVAHLSTLRRLSVGKFGIEEAHTLAAVEERDAEVVLNPAQAVRSMPSIRPNGEMLVKINNGGMFSATEFLTADLLEHPGPFATLRADGTLVAVYERRKDPRGVKPAVVMAHVREQ